MELAWARFPPASVSATQNRANSLPSPGRRRPFFMYSMGPPRQRPSGPFSRWRTARVFSPQLTAIPSRAEIHIQNTAPGPPYTMAAATPAMDPVPMVAARAVDRAWSWVTPLPSPAAFFRRSREPTVVFHHTGRPNSGKNPVAKEYHSPTARNAASSGPPHRKSPSRAKKAMSPAPPIEGVPRRPTGGAEPSKARYADMAQVMRGTCRHPSQGAAFSSSPLCFPPSQPGRFHSFSRDA